MEVGNLGSWVVSGWLRGCCEGRQVPPCCAMLDGSCLELLRVLLARLGIKLLVLGSVGSKVKAAKDVGIRMTAAGRLRGRPVDKATLGCGE